jgi:hypothetical protein
MRSVAGQTETELGGRLSVLVRQHAPASSGPAAPLARANGA